VKENVEMENTIVKLKVFEPSKRLTSHASNIYIQIRSRAKSWGFNKTPINCATTRYWANTANKEFE
jgi:hypothetical protein